MRKLSFAVYPCMFSLMLVMSAPAASLFNLGANWKYFVGTQEASTPQTAWRAIVFDDSTWTSGNAPIGYGEPDIVLPAVPTATLSVYHRKTFVISDPAQITRLDLTIRIDDGFVAWINGVQVGRTNVPDGELAWNAAAPLALEPTTHVLTITDLGSILVAGTNVVAIHAINQSSASS
ncbi:MAG TPA: hypothetical protein VK846_07200, partial [Candidatus Limnocylindria bacterium]|nr:hypothetical protein [Candidatus Limnocylindria bacterium]